MKLSRERELVLYVLDHFEGAGDID